jgi:hypothetical protein
VFADNLLQKLKTGLEDSIIVFRIVVAFEIALGKNKHDASTDELRKVHERHDWD